MNSVVHFEIPTKDVKRAQKFYQDMFGWQIQELPEMNYTMVTTTVVDDQTHMPKMPGAINGGMTTNDSAKGAVLVIDVPSIDEHIKKLEDAGIKVVMPKTTVGDMGYYARFEDPEGNIVGIWETIKK